MTVEGAGMAGKGARGGNGRWWTLGASTPHLASPLKGGRDELGKGVEVGAW